MYCDKCNKDRGYQRKNVHGHGLCRVCVSSHIHSGKVVSEESKKKMSKNNHLNNGGVHPMRGRKHSEETKAKLSRAATRQSKRYKGNFSYNGSVGEIRMRSSWEVKYAEWLDAQNITWSYEPTFELSNGKLYTPDFKLEDGTVIEIKGYFRGDAKKKWNMFVEEYPDINKQLLMKAELKELGVL